jgi:hypothetical protein
LFLIKKFFKRAFKYLRASDVNSLEFYEKYFILYNSVSEKDFKIAAQYLWLFQKLNANSIGASQLGNDEGERNTKAYSASSNSGSMIENDLTLFKCLTQSKNSANLSDLNNQTFQNKYSHEQRMHFRLILTIYLANS